MKTLRWALLLAIVVVVLAAIVHIRRDSIARGIANSVFSETDIAVTELSVDSLSTDRLELSELVIESASGARYEIFGLSIPLRTSDSAIELISVDRLIVHYATSQDTETMLSTSLQTVLDLPLIDSNLEATVARLSLPNLPEMTDVVWVTRDQAQALSFVLDTIRITAGIDRLEDKRHRVKIRATQADGDTGEVLSADFALSKDGERFSATGPSMLRLAAWAPLLRTLELLPDSLERLGAQLQGPTQITLDDPHPGLATFNAQLALGGDLAATYRTSGGEAIDMLVSALDQLAIESDYPAFDWTARAEMTEAILDTDDLEDLPVVINGLECRKGIHCRMNVAIDTQNLAWNGYDVEKTELSLPLQFEFGELTRIDVSADARGMFSGVRTSDLSAASIDITSFSGTQLFIDEEAWRCRIDELQLAVTEFTGAGELMASFPMTFNDLKVSDSARTVETRLSVPPGAEGSWDGIAVLLPGATGSLTIRNEQLTTSLQLDDRYEALSASVELSRNLAQDSGMLNVSNTQLLFDRAALSDLLPGWPYPLDVVDGTWEAQAHINWRMSGNNLEFSGEVMQILDSLAGQYNDIAFIGLSTGMEAALDAETGIAVSPTHLDVRLLDVGLPLERISADYTIDWPGRAVDVQALSMAALGGEFTAESFRFSPDAETNPILLRADAIQLQLMVDIAEFENIEMTGAISGELPMTMRGTNITIEDGRLQSDAPGGVIRYLSDDETIAAVAPDSQLSIVTRALNNFEFDSLSSDVNYTESGDLKLQMRLSGINPDMDATQPIILNLNVENNVPQLLRSLRAVRSIEDILERQTANQAN
jgi:hypothetical protein